MEKAILVMDMPKNCAECRFSTIGCQDNDICYLNNKEIYLDKKPNWCPLKTIPEKKDTDQFISSRIFEAAGYNECIDDILSK